MVKRARATYLLMRLGAAFALLYPALDAWFEPYTWAGYLPSFARGYVPDTALLNLFGVVEITLALWILSGIKIFWPSIVATGLLISIVVFNPHEFSVLFRDLSIASLTFALALMQAQKTSTPTESLEFKKQL
ncbi:hypothetical protein HYS79_02335 [Patescibacteria group bacterium]|nr:hypothetical protein [Patescibacteria group bacterium]